jgi:hypothetical protein
MSPILASDRRLAALRKIQGLRSARWLTFALLAFCLSSAAFTVGEQFGKIGRVGEIGYGDNYILQTVLRFQKTGIIYAAPDAATAIPAAAQYSPLVYILLSLPGRLMPLENPFIGPRLVEISAFLLCVAAIASITRVLIPHPWAWRWGVLLALSVESMRGWIMQLRGDFPGIFFSLVSIRLLMARSRWCVPLAGAAAGFATQFKLTYVSAIVAGSLWLAAQRRWKAATEFIGAAIVASLGIYCLFLLREPRMLDQLLVLRHALKDYRALFDSIGMGVLREPVLLLGLAIAIPIIALGRWSRWWLLIGYFAISLVLAAASDVQAGGNINYFFEALFALVPLAAFGALQLGRRPFGTAGLFLSGLLLFHIAAPDAVSAFHSIRRGRSETASWNLHMAALRGVLQGNRVLSTVPTATYLAPETVISEPFLLSTLDRQGLIDLQPLSNRILGHEFDIVVTPAEADSWRGVPNMPAGLRPAIAAAYRPFCIFQGWLIHLPGQPSHPGLPEQFTAIGCTAVVPGVAANNW